MSVAEISERRPTEADPQRGCAMLAPGGEPLLISEGEWWVEDNGDYVIRSLEFDVIAGGPTFREALAKFIHDVFEFGIYLGELEDPAENEEEMFHLLAPRALRAIREMERVESERVEARPKLRSLLPRRRRSGEDVRAWHPSSRQPGSLRPSNV